MKLYLGVDGGATKTTAVVIDGNKNVLNQGSAAGSNANICLAIAGVNPEKDQVNWQKAIANDPRFSLLGKSPLLVNDTVAALRSGTTDSNAIVSISGTGSNCYGRNEKGRVAKSGGGDYILGDQGSGYDIGLKNFKKCHEIA